MKKGVLSAVLSATMLFSVVPITHAETISYGEEGGNKIIDVPAVVTKKNGIDVGGNRYYMTLSWDIESALYESGENSYEWDPIEMKYILVSNGISGSLTGTDAKSDFVITNQSNAPISYEISYESINGFDTTETAVNNSLKTGTIESVVPVDYQIPSTGLSEYGGFTANSSNYKGNVKLNTYPTALQETAVGTYTITISTK